MMSRKKKLLLNTGAAVIHQVIALICGFVLPRLIISHYGSATNGLLSSITQFLAFFSMMEMGVGAVVRASLYKPLADYDQDAISRVLISSRRFFKKIGFMLCIYTGTLMIYFPLAVDHSNGYLSTVILVGSIAFGSLANYFLGIVYQQLLNADQKSYVQLFISALTTIINTSFGVILIHLNASIEMVKLLAAVVTLLRPLLLKIYVDRHYKLNFRLELTGEPIKQKWNGLAQHIAQYVLRHADTVILTMFSTLENVSIYYVYHLVTSGLQQMIEILTTGMGALLGDMYAKEEHEKLDRTFSALEWLIHTIVVFVFGVAGVLIIPFVAVYTKGITDVNYIVPLFAALIVFANGTYCLRSPYNLMVISAGHFKQTQASAIIEALINVVISIVLVWHYGLVGVAVGTFVAMLYRTVYLAWYLKKNILYRKFSLFLKHCMVDIITLVSIIIATDQIQMDSSTWIGWIIMAVKVGLIAFGICGIVNVLFYRDQIKNALILITKKKIA